MHCELQVCPKGQFHHTPSKCLVWLHGEWWEKERNSLCPRGCAAVLLQSIKKQLAFVFFFWLPKMVGACLNSSSLQKQVLCFFLHREVSILYLAVLQAELLSCWSMRKCYSHTLCTPFSSLPGGWRIGELVSGSYLLHYSGFPLQPHLVSACSPPGLSEREFVCPSDYLTHTQFSHVLRSGARLYSQSEL